MKAAAAGPLAPFTGFHKDGLSWFRGLALAQNREWFQAHKAAYEELWLNPMKSLLAEVKVPLAKIYGRRVGEPKIFRLNRDVRFSKNKNPYKTNISGMIRFKGDESGAFEGPAALYLHLGLDEVVAFGFYFLEPENLKRLRMKIVDEKVGAGLQKLVNAAAKKGLALDGMETLKRAPVGFDPKHPRVELLKHKGLALSSSGVPKNVRFTVGLKKWVLDQAKAAAPVVKWGLAHKLNG